MKEKVHYIEASEKNFQAFKQRLLKEEKNSLSRFGFFLLALLMLVLSVLIFRFADNLFPRYLFGILSFILFLFFLIGSFTGEKVKNISDDELKEYYSAEKKFQKKFFVLGKKKSD